MAHFNDLGSTHISSYHNMRSGKNYNYVNYRTASCATIETLCYIVNFTENCLIP